MSIIKLNKSERRKLALFLTCLCVAVTAWLFFSLGNRYVYLVNTQVNYVNLPQNKAFHPLQSDTVDLQIEGTGWQLMFARLHIKPQAVSINLKSLNAHSYVTLSDQLEAINMQLESNQHVVSVVPDTLYFDFSDRAVKKVPVRLAYDLSFKKQFGISSPIDISPAYVIVTGPEEDLKKVKYWSTDSLTLKDLSSSVASKIALQKSSRANVTIYPFSVDIKITVDEFTEKSVEVPLKILNNTNLDIKLLPEKVKVTFLTALSNYQAGNRESFEATLDLSNWKKGYKQLPVHINSMPSNIKLINVEPQTVDFIIRN